MDAFFVADMWVNFRTGFVKKSGAICWDSNRIRRHYLRGWFPVDFASTVPVDLIVKIATAGGPATGNLRALKLLRVLRLVKLMKLMRLAKLGALFDQCVTSPRRVETALLPKAGGAAGKIAASSVAHALAPCNHTQARGPRRNEFFADATAENVLDGSVHGALARLCLVSHLRH